MKVHVGVSHSKLFLDGEQIDVQTLASECLLEGKISSIRIGFDVLLGRLLDIIEIMVSNGSAKLLPSNLSRDVCNMGSVDLSRILACESLVTFLLAIVTDSWRLGGAVCGTVTLLLAETAGTSEIASDSLVGALGLRVTGRC